MSKSKSYPIVGPWQQTTKETYPYPPNCMKCGKDYTKETFWRREIQVSYFRGDDVVETLCQECKEK